MPATRPRLSCGHRGFGAPCHRCAQAKVLATKAEGLKEGDARAKLLLEAKRLGSPTVKSYSPSL